MRHKLIIQAGIMVAGALLCVTATLKSQAPARTTQVWEYSSVSGMTFSYKSANSGITRDWLSSATICYATAQGCRQEDIAKNVPNQWDGAEAIMLAAAKLGAEGWELTTSTDATESNGDNKRVLYFRRLKPESK